MQQPHAQEMRPPQALMYTLAALQVLRSAPYQQWLQSLGSSYQHLLLPPGVAVTPTLAGAAKLQVSPTAPLQGAATGTSPA